MIEKHNTLQNKCCFAYKNAIWRNSMLLCIQKFGNGTKCHLRYHPDNGYYCCIGVTCKMFCLFPTLCTLLAAGTTSLSFYEQYTLQKAHAVLYLASYLLSTELCSPPLLAICRSSSVYFLFNNKTVQIQWQTLIQMTLKREWQGW